MDAKLEIHLDGTSTLSRYPERGILSIAVSSTSTSKVSVSEDVTKCSNELQGLIRPLNAKDADTGQPTPEAAVTWWSMRSISTRTWIPSEWNAKEGRQIQGERQYSASTSFQIKFKDFQKLSAVATDFAVKEFVTVNGVSWELTDQTKASLASENRRKALRNAIVKARDYAQEIKGDAAAARVVEIHETDMNGQGFGGARRQMAQHAPRGPAQDEQGLNLKPEDVDLNAKVKVKFIVD